MVFISFNFEDLDRLVRRARRKSPSIVVENGIVLVHVESANVPSSTDRPSAALSGMEVKVGAYDHIIMTRI